MKEFNKIYDKLLELGCFTEPELQLVCDLNGSDIETLNNAIFSRYGYNDFEQLIENEYNGEEL